METRTIQQMVAQYSHGQPSGKVDMKRFGNKLVGTYLMFSLIIIPGVYFDDILLHGPPDIH